VGLSFTWDEAKNIENIRKHGVAFTEASSIFRRIPCEIFNDPDHSDYEHRYIAIGFSDKARALLVSHTENATGTGIRIISARKATKQERIDAFGE
jgi:uncharacterized protein